MTYQEAFGLDSWIVLWYQARLGAYGLDALKNWGNPQDNPGKVYRGTNGKGSTVNALQTILPRQAMKLEPLPRPILLTSRNESLKGQMISEEDLPDLVSRVKPVVERLPKRQSMKMRQSLKLSQS